MAQFERKTWFNEPDPRTPVNEVGLDDLEGRIETVVNTFQDEVDVLMSATDAHVKDLLTKLGAFSTIDKIIWRTDSGTVVELWGEILNIGSVTHSRLVVGIKPLNADRQEIPIIDLAQDGSVGNAVNLLAVNTTGKNNAQIDSSLAYAAKDGMMIHDPTNHLLLVRQGGSWSKFAAV
jgi:hypothetical protein